MSDAFRGLRLGPAYPRGAGGTAVQAELADGTPAVLKVVSPHREAEHEADALEAWDGDGAVRLLARDGNRLLLERCEPGTYLAAAGEERALDVFVALLPRLWKPAGTPFRPLAGEAAWWAAELEPRRGDRLVDAALAAIRDLAPTQGEQVLLDQDLHAENVLAAEREPWLAIDPKPLTGERELAVAPIVRGASSRRELGRRLDRLTAELGLDRERARGWALVQAVAWDHPEVASWLVKSP